MMRLAIIALFPIAALSQIQPPPSGPGGSCSSLGGQVTGTCAATVVSSVTTQTNGDSSSAPASDLFVQSAVASIPQPGGNPGYSPNQTISGCGVQYTSGLSFTVGACNYLIAGVAYSSPLTTLTLAAADPTNPRIDLIVVNTSAAAVVLTGTPAASPVAPSVDPSTQLAISFGLTVAANASTPSVVSATTLYDENTEWTCTPSANINCASTNNPYHLTKDVEATNAAITNNFTLVKPASGTVDLSGFNTLTFYIRSKAAWPTGNGGANAARFLSIFWLNGSTQKGNQVVLRDGQFGFSSSITNAYQQINIPVSLFAINGIPVTTLEVLVSGNSGTSTFGWYIDYVTLQSGSAVISGVTQTIASGNAALGTSSISSGACATVVTATATGVLTSDNIMADFNADPTSTTGYQASSSGMLTIIKYPTANNVNFKVCNNTGSSITPGSVTLNWRVVR